MNATRSAAAVVVVLAALGACGDEGPVVDPDTAGAAATIAPDSPTSPDALELPDELAAVVRPVEITGDPLPPHETGSITADPARGMKAPIISGEGYDGRTVRIDAVAGGPTMVVFLAHWCPHCNDEIPRINELRDEGRFPAGLNIVGVSTAMSPGRPNFPPDVWLDGKDWTYPVVADDIDLEREVLVAADAMGVTGFPFVVLIDGDGVVQARWSGGRQPDELLELVTSNLSFG